MLRALKMYSPLHQENFHLCQSISNNHVILKYLLMIRQARRIIYKISSKISNFYSFPMLLIIFYDRCASIDNIYFILLWFFKLKNSSFNISSTISSLFWILVNGYPIIIMSTSVKKFTIEVCKFTDHASQKLQHFVQDLRSFQMEKTIDIVYDVREKYIYNTDIVSGVFSNNCCFFFVNINNSFILSS